LSLLPEPEVAIIMIGANDVKERLDRAASVRVLSETVSHLVELGTEVVVGTCPDLGSVRPSRHPRAPRVGAGGRALPPPRRVAAAAPAWGPGGPSRNRCARWWSAGAGTWPPPRRWRSLRPVGAPSRWVTCSAPRSGPRPWRCSARTGCTRRRPATPGLPQRCF